MAALDIRQKISPNQSFYQREKNWDPYKTYLSTITTRWWHWLAWNLRLLAPNLPFSSLPHTASLSLLSVNSWITHDDFMYPTYGTSSRILSWPLLTAKQEMSPNIWDHWSIQYGCWPSKVYIFLCSSFFSFAHDIPPIDCYLVGKGTGVRLFRPNLSKHPLMFPIPTINSANLPSNIKSQKRNSLYVQKNLFQRGLREYCED